MYFHLEDVRDALLRDILTEEDILESTNYVNGLAARLNVAPDKIRIPAPYPVSQLALFYALMVCARNASMQVTGRDLQAGDDPYERKRAIYEREYKTWEARITAETLTGIDGKPSDSAIPLTTRVART